jgi:hypothetical protein
MNNVICITGMHRSGTSLTTSWLEFCGLKIHDGSYHGPSVGNSKGHFEDKEFVHIHSSAIKSEFPDSKGWLIFSQKKMIFSNEDLVNISRLVNQRNQKFSLWGWKDPRSVMFLNGWKRIIPALKALIIWRPCVEVVTSLLKRSKKAKADVFKINANESIKLWIAYNKRAYEYKKKFPDETLLLPLEVIIKNDQKVLSTINRTFQTSLDYKSISSVFDNNLLKKKRADMIPKIISRTNGTRVLEREMMDLSDIKI